MQNVLQYALQNDKIILIQGNYEIDDDYQNMIGVWNMIYKATKLIKQEMDKQELNSSINEYEKSSNVQAGYNIQNGP